MRKPSGIMAMRTASHMSTVARRFLNFRAALIDWTVRLGRASTGSATRVIVSPALRRSGVRSLCAPRSPPLGRLAALVSQRPPEEALGAVEDGARPEVDEDG